MQVFTGTGTYTGVSGTTDAEGAVSFDLSPGSYKFRSRVLVTNFYSDVVTIPDTLSLTHTIPHADVTVTVQKTYAAQTTPLPATKVMLKLDSNLLNLEVNPS